MTRCDALVVGGGPGGSTCARALRNAGWDVIVADRASFPRDKVCAGWLTPDVFRLLDLTPDEYRAAGLTLQEIAAFRTGLMGAPLIETRYSRTVSYGIRRCEFDHFLLQRAGVRVLDGTPVTSLRRGGDAWIVNEDIQTQVVVGAGGHFCPVARHVRGDRDTRTPIVAKEAEFRLSERDARSVSTTPELFFCRDLDGYGWSVRKGDYLNVGIGRRTRDDFGAHVRHFVEFLEERGVLPQVSGLRWHGHAYFASGTGSLPLVADGLLLVGDAAGLAYPESGEGIRPAIASGQSAAEVLIAARGRHGVEDLQPYADSLRRLHPPASRPAKRLRTAFAALGRMLLASPTFTRHVLLDRWFLRDYTGTWGHLSSRPSA